MTRADITQAVRNLVTEREGDAGALLDDSGNLLEIISDAQEQVVLDLIPIMPGQLLTTEDVNLVASQDYVTITKEFWQLYKVEKRETGKLPKELDIIDPLDIQDHGAVGDTEERPDACYLLGDTLYLVKTPSTSKTGWLRLYLVMPEAVEMDEDGPQYIPRPAHRLIVHRSASMVSTLIGADPTPFELYYTSRLRMIEKVWAARTHQPRFVRSSFLERKARDDREEHLYDKNWP